MSQSPSLEWWAPEVSDTSKIADALGGILSTKLEASDREVRGWQRQDRMCEPRRGNLRSPHPIDLLILATS